MMLVPYLIFGGTTPGLRAVRVYPLRVGSGKPIRGCLGWNPGRPLARPGWSCLPAAASPFPAPSLRCWLAL